MHRMKHHGHPSKKELIAVSPDRSMRWNEAYQAWRKLYKDPGRTEYVFEIIDALRGNADLRGLKRFRSSERGKKLLADRPEILPTLTDLKTLETLPIESFGFAYAKFMREGEITASGLIQASEKTPIYDGCPEDLLYFVTRRRDTHDLWHVVTGYGRDLRGEAALLAFDFAQNWHWGIGFIALMAYLNAKGTADRMLLWRAFVAGRKTEWLTSAPWETMLALPLALVRTLLNGSVSPKYDPLWSLTPSDVK